MLKVHDKEYKMKSRLVLLYMSLIASFFLVNSNIASGHNRAIYYSQNGTDKVRDLTYEKIITTSGTYGPNELGSVIDCGGEKVGILVLAEGVTIENVEVKGCIMWGIYILRDYAYNANWSDCGNKPNTGSCLEPLVGDGNTPTGVTASYAQAVINNCYLNGNSSGVGIASRGSVNPSVIKNCTFTDNVISVDVWEGSPIIENNDITQGGTSAFLFYNRYGRGDGSDDYTIYPTLNTIKIRNNIIEGAITAGGVLIRFEDHASAIIDENYIQANEANNNIIDTVNMTYPENPVQDPSIEIKNNIFSRLDGSSGVESKIHIAKTVKLTATNNIFFGWGTDSTPFRFANRPQGGATELAYNNIVFGEQLELLSFLNLTEYSGNQKVLTEFTGNMGPFAIKYPVATNNEDFVVRFLHSNGVGKQSGFIDLLNGYLTSGIDPSAYDRRTPVGSGVVGYLDFHPTNGNCQDSDNDSYYSSLGCGSYTVDCNDSNAYINPGKAEVCNLVDDNCDGQIDEGFVKYTYYRDFDGDGYGDINTTKLTCMEPNGYVSDASDSDDTNSSVHLANTLTITNRTIDGGHPASATTIKAINKIVITPETIIKPNIILSVN